MSACGEREEWRAVIGYKGRYEVSSLGRVRSVARNFWQRGKYNNTVLYHKKSRLLKPSPERPEHRYPVVVLHKKPLKQRTRAVHLLVLEAFVGLCPKGLEACHWDGDHRNARLTNLRWDTSKSNKADMLRHGTVARGKMLPQTRFTAEQVLYIRRRKAAGEHMTKMAKEYDVHQRTIEAICARRSWAYL